VGKLWDIVIVGGGLGGLSLAAELAAPAFAAMSVLVLEKRSRYVRDRTWSYWATTPHKYSHLERYQWNNWTVSLGDVVYSQCSQRSRYASLDADAFYKNAVDVICNSSHISLRMNACVTNIEPFGSSETVITLEQGHTVRAKKILDARPVQQSTPGTLVQQFVGWEIQLERDVFDSSQIQLMSFQPNRHGLHFFYVLPYSARCALVESTWISSADWHPDYDTELKRYISQLCGSNDYSVVYSEHGVLNLQDEHLHAAAPVGLGRRGGTLRPSTGYAFVDTLVHAAQLAKSLMEALHAGTQDAWQPFAFRRGATEKWMDTIFLEVLTKDWQRAPDYFMRIFSSVQVDDTVAFLTGQVSWQQRLRIMLSLPVAPFARVALQHCFRGLRTGKPPDHSLGTRW
jgi:lycopene beta-cyclase